MTPNLPQPLPDAWPAELRLLCSQLRAALGTATEADLARLTQPVDWNAWLRWVQRHRVEAYLQRHLPSAVRAALPAPVAAQLRTLGLTNAQRAMARAGELIRGTQLLAQQGIRSLAFKGPVLGVQLYDEPGVRHAGDLDLLLAPADVARADAVLRETGYQRAQPDFELTPFQWRKFLDLHHEVSLWNPERRIAVELQWQLEGLPDASFEALWPARVPVSVAGETLLTLPEAVRPLHLFTHGAKHGWAMLSWLLDGALLLRDDQVSKTAWWPTAQHAHLTRPLLQGAALAARLLNVALPPELAARLATARALPGLVEDALARMGREPSGKPGISATLRDTAYQFRLQESARGRLALVQPRLLSAENWKQFPLPERWFWLYYPAAPFLWARRRLFAPAGKPLKPPAAV